MIVYTPIDIKCKVPDQKILVEYVKENYLNKNALLNALLCPIVFRKKVNDWRDASEIFIEDDFLDLTDKDPIYYRPGIKELMPELIEILESLPFKQIIGGGLYLQTGIVDAHHDMTIDFTYPKSPERYNVLLTDHYDRNSFFIAKTQDSPKDYPIILKDYPIYAFNDQQAFHGADPVVEDRVILICSGLLDHQKHEELIERSVEKFKDYVIRYEY